MSAYSRSASAVPGAASLTAVRTKYRFLGLRGGGGQMQCNEHLGNEGIGSGISSPTHPARESKLAREGAIFINHPSTTT